MLVSEKEFERLKRDPLVQTASNGDLKIVSSLLGKPHEDTVLSLAFVNAAYEGHLPVVAMLLDHGVDPNVIAPNGQTVLHAAVRNWQLKVVRFLLNHGADTNFVDMVGTTTLHHAIDTEVQIHLDTYYDANGDIVPVPTNATVLLLNYGANPLAHSPSGTTPLDTAKHQAHEPSLRLMQDVLKNNQRDQQK